MQYGSIYLEENVRRDSHRNYKRKEFSQNSQELL